MGVGIYFDVLISLLPLWLFYFLLGIHERSAIVISGILNSIFVISALSSALYFRFFGSKLYWWVIVGHTGDTLSVFDAILQLSQNPWILSGTIAGTLSIIGFLLMFFIARPARYLFKPPSQLKFWPIQGLIGLLALFVLVSLQQAPLKHKKLFNRMFNTQHDLSQIRSPVSDHFLIRWAPEWRQKRTFGDFNSVQLSNLSIEEQKKPAQFLVSFAEKRSALPSVSPDPPFPILRPLILNSKLKTQWRSALGFNDSEKMNVVLLFMESVRGFEYFHPELGESTFPNLHRLSREKALSFDRYYTVSTGAGATVRGMFATLCSQYPNPLGPAPYLFNPSIRASCLPELLSAWEVQTHMYIASADNYHNKKLFESRHGTTEIMGKDQIDPDKKFPRNSLGILDPDYFTSLLNYVGSAADKGLPFFLHGINVGTHIPWKVTDGKNLENYKKHGSGEWLGLIDQFQSYDSNVATFIEKFLTDPKQASTVLVLVSDHSNIVSNDPKPWGTPASIERSLRVPLFFFSQKIKKPQVFHFPLTQLDLAPTIANFMHPTPITLTAPLPNVLQSTFLGQMINLEDPQSASLRAYSFPEGRSFYSQSGDNCYQENPTAEAVCYQTQNGIDPLFEEPPKVASASAADDLLFSRKLIEASFLVLSLDRLLPKKDSQFPILNPAHK